MRWTVVTGGSKRLGAEICRSLAAEGNSILVHYHNSRREAEEVASECRMLGADAETVKGDFSSTEATLSFADECLKQFPQIKTLVNNVGNYLIKPAGETTPEEWNGLFQTNLHAPFTLIHSFLPSLKACKGSVVNIGVVNANNIHAEIKRTAYMATKMSMLMLTKSLAKELSPAGVRVNMVSPGYLDNAIDLDGAYLPMHRPACLAEVCSVISFLLKADNCYITGQNIEVGGGVGL